MQKLIIYLGFFLALTACAHKIDIQQGNVVTEEQLSALQTGMDMARVRQIMGTPMLTDPFHQERWDYYYSMQQGGELVEHYRVTLHFAANRLLRIERKGEIPEKDLPQLKQQKK